MLFDILAVFVVTLISSLFLCSTSIHGLPSSSAAVRLIRRSSSDDYSSSLRLLNHRPVSNVDNDSGGDISEILFGESNENDDLFLTPLDVKYHLPSILQKRSSSLSSTPFQLNSAVVTGAFDDSSNTADSNQSEDSIRLSPSLTNLVKTNPFARAWLKMLLEKLMKEKPAPYIFKYGRRRK